MEEEFRTVLQFMIRTYNEGILDPKFDMSDSSSLEKKVLAGNVFFWMDNGVLASMYTEQLRKTNPYASINSMPLMTNSFGNKEGLAWTQLTNYGTQYCLSAKAKYPDRLLEFMDWCYTEEALLINTYGEKDKTYKLDKDGKPYVPESVWKKYEKAAQPNYQWMSDLGLGQLCFAPFYDNMGVVWENYEVDEEDAICDNTSPTMQVFSTDDIGRMAETTEIIEIEVNNHNAKYEFAVFADSVINDKPMEMGAEEGAKTVATCLAIVESSKTGTPIKPDYKF